MGAIISPCGTYRYWLERGPADAPYVAWVLANPSTADAELDDPTVRKARGFTERLGFKRFVFVNVFAYRATKPRDVLKFTGHRMGPDNLSYIEKAAGSAETVIVAWGNAIAKPLRGNVQRVEALLHNTGHKLHCYGVTVDGSPRHPLMLAYTTPLEIYKP